VVNPWRPADRSSCGSVSEDAENIPAITPLLDPTGLDSVMLAYPRVPVLLLIAREVCGVVPPDVVAHPPPWGDEVSRVLAAEVDEDPERGLSGIFGAFGPILREAGVPRAAALCLDLTIELA
jgi:hypothetical protein